MEIDIDKAVIMLSLAVKNTIDRLGIQNVNSLYYTIDQESGSESIRFLYDEDDTIRCLLFIHEQDAQYSANLVNEHSKHQQNLEVVDVDTQTAISVAILNKVAHVMIVDSTDDNVMKGRSINIKDSVDTLEQSGALALLIDSYNAFVKTKRSDENDIQTSK
jgi:hypothetical protein